MSTTNEKVIEFQITRYDPERNTRYRSTYPVLILKGMTILDALLHIKDHVDGTLTFRHSCRMGQCGSCGVLVNGTPMLACYTQVLPLGVDIVELDALPNLPLIKDLVVDDQPLFEKFAHITPTLRRRDEDPSTLTELIQLPRELKQYWTESTCILCALCYGACPAAIDRTFLGPSSLTRNYRFVKDTRDEGRSDRLNTAADTIWLCTSCQSCTLTCPKEIDCATVLDDERGAIVDANTRIPGTANDVFTSTRQCHNPMHRAPKNRVAWSQDLDLAELSRVRKTDILYFVGCLPAYDPRNQHVAKAIAHIFHTMNVDFAILGTEEWCCGDHILRLGQKALFQVLAEHTISLLKQYDFKRLVTISPHCYHTFSTKTPYTDISLNVQHYTQLFATAITNGRLKPVKAIDKTVTYHDPCFLGKRSDIYDPPRDILRSIPGLDLVEMERSRVTSFCCGGGAGRMWTETAPVDQRPGVHRVREALNLGVDVIATACPFCITTLEEAVKALDVQETLTVRGVAELLGDALDVSESQR